MTNINDTTASTANISFQNPKLEQISAKDIVGLTILHLVILIICMIGIYFLIAKTDKTFTLKQKLKHFFYFISQYFFLPFLFLYLLINLTVMGVTFLWCKDIHYITLNNTIDFFQKIFNCQSDQCKKCCSYWICNVCKCCKKNKVQKIKIESKIENKQIKPQEVNEGIMINNDKKDNEQKKDRSGKYLESVNNKSYDPMVIKQVNNLNLQIELTPNNVTIKNENEPSRIISNNFKLVNNNNQPKIINNQNNIQDDNIVIPTAQIEERNIGRPSVKKPVNKSKIMEFLEGALVNENNNPVFINLFTQVKDKVKDKKDNQNREKACNQTNILGKY